MSETMKKRRKWPWTTGGGVAAIIVISAIASGGGSDGTIAQPSGVPVGNEAKPAEQPDQQPAERTVVYRVTGTGTASSITYTTDGMTTSNQESNVTLPWEKTIKLPAGEAMQLVSVLAQGSGSSSLKVVIEVDGEVFKEASAEGYGVAMANGNIGTFG